MWNHRPVVGEIVDVSFVHQDKTQTVIVDEVGVDYYVLSGSKIHLDNIDGIRERS